MKPDPECQQLPKRSIKDDWVKPMTGGVKKLRLPPKPKPKPKKPSDKPHKKTATATGPTRRTAASSNTGATKPPLNIPMKDMSPEFKRIVVEEDHEGDHGQGRGEEEERLEEADLVFCKVAYL